MPLTIGSRLGPYEIIAPLGAGGMGEVYRAKELRLNRQVAKVLPPAGASAGEWDARFIREVHGAVPPRLRFDPRRMLPETKFTIAGTSTKAPAALRLHLPTRPT